MPFYGSEPHAGNYAVFLIVIFDFLKPADWNDTYWIKPKRVVPLGRKVGTTCEILTLEMLKKKKKTPSLCSHSENVFFFPLEE